jgi:hypothetical protein
VLEVKDDFRYKSDSLAYLDSRLEEVEYKECGLTLEKYCIFLKAVESDKVLKPTLEKSSKLRLELSEDGDSTT